MKNKTAIAISAITALLVGCAVSLTVFDRGLCRKYKEEITSLPKNFTVTAHSGSMKTPQNSIQSILIGAQNADIIEFDLNFTKDKAAVLSHDEPKGGEVTLNEAFEALASIKKTKANVDIKSTANLSAIEKSAEQYGVSERIFFTGVDENMVGEVQRQCSNVPYYLNVGVDAKKNEDNGYLLSLVEKVKENGAVGINMHFGGASKKLVEVFHENGLLVSIWTVDKKKDMYKILSYSPDNITTRNPDVLGEIIADITRAVS